MESTAYASPRKARGPIVPRPKVNGFTQPPDESWRRLLRGHALRVFLFLVSTTRSWRRYCDATVPEITAALNGGNPKQTQFTREDYGMSMNARGELIDPWGTPYFFHQLSGTEMEIRSAGPDRIMWTADDLVIK